ncbi:glutathione peroxidase [Salsuginibacillus halophilus]|uniref:Glutathione peroxidase n=1 Tax=Salsuginibacillus halophilus TaxID=517424 RepID=A0A2P8HQY5_9BACI|nr:glutathione peroxidase [Salsuginibacillus halophilus]PSL48592.1 glutathione peroxidase [Salsuginibacillus halophilus]
MTQIYDFTAEKANGQEVSLADYKGKVLLVVNTATECGFTPQLEDLQKLYSRYGGENFEILGFPCNQFAEQEPKADDEMTSHCKANFGVTFPMFKKIDVNGENAHPLFTYLQNTKSFQGFNLNTPTAKLMKKIITDRYPDLLSGDTIKWNFTKFLITGDGKVLRRYEPTDEPLDFEKDIRQLVNFSAAT